MTQPVMPEGNQPSGFAAFFDKIKTRTVSLWEYVSQDVWNDTRDNWRVNTVKTINLTVR